MKFIFSFALLLIAFSSFSQITINDILKITKMNSDEFELFAIDKGYHFNKYKDEYNQEGVVYSKGGGSNYKCLTFYYKNKFVESVKEIYYLTSNTREVLNFKKSIIIYGFKSSTIDLNEEYKSKFESYSKNGKQIYIHTYPPDEEFPYVQYTIQFWMYK